LWKGQGIQQGRPVPRPEQVSLTPDVRSRYDFANPTKRYCSCSCSFNRLTAITLPVDAFGGVRNVSF
jgi:hypothetical protein